MSIRIILRGTQVNISTKFHGNQSKSWTKVVNQLTDRDQHPYTD